MSLQGASKLSGHCIQIKKFSKSGLLWISVKSENHIMPFGKLDTVPPSQICVSVRRRRAQAQQGTLRRLFRRNCNDIEQEASLASCPSEIPGLLRDGCLEFCKLMRGTICSTLLADVSPHPVPVPPNEEVCRGLQQHSVREDCAIQQLRNLGTKPIFNLCIYAFQYASSVQV